MKKYDFDYINQKYTTNLILSLFLLFFILLFTTIFIAANYLIKSGLIFFSCLLLSFGIPYIIYIFKRKNIKKEGSAIIYDSYVEFTLDKLDKQIKFNEIKSYIVQNYKATALNIILKNGEKFSIASNNVNCDIVKFNYFCSDIESALEAYNSKNNNEIVRQKNIFEKGWIYPLLIILTLVIIVMVGYAMISGIHIPSYRYFAAIGPLLSLWGMYYSGKNKRK